MKKILIVSTVSRQFYLFEQGNIEVLKSLGYEVHGAANFDDANERLDALDIVRHHFDIQRSPFSLKNIQAYRQLKNIMKTEKFDAVHCHSPMGGVLARLAAKAVGIKLVIYTAHGFHFYKGAPIINWLIYYPVEKFLSRYTDVLITINKEDYERAQEFNAKKVKYVPGIGVDIKKINTSDAKRRKKREELGLKNDSFVILSVGELNKNKNHETVIRALAKIENHNSIYLICGQGEKEQHLKNVARSIGVSGRVKLLGFRNDVYEIYKASDVFAFPSFREGLSVSLMEAMASRLPVICSDIRGNRDLIDIKKGGYLIEPNNVDRFVEFLNILSKSVQDRDNMGLYNLLKIMRFSKENIMKEMGKVYNEVFRNE